MKKITQAYVKTRHALSMVIMATIMIASYTTNAQVAVNTDGSSADASAMLDVKSTTSGVLISRMTATERDNISSPATGLMVYVTTDNKFYYYDGTQWVNWVDAADGDWTVSGNNMYSAVSGNVGIGTSTPGTYKLYVNGAQCINGNLIFDFEKSIYGIDQLVGYNDLRFYVDSSGTTEQLRLSNSGGLSLGNSYTTTDPGAGKMIIKNSLGIGTMNPAMALDVYGTIRSGDFSASGGQNFIIGDDIYLSDLDVPNTLGIYGIPNYTVATIKLGSSGGTISGENNNIGIGTTSPGEKLDINGAMHLTPGSAPSTANEGDIYMDSSTHKLRCFDGTTWHDLW